MAVLPRPPFRFAVLAGGLFRAVRCPGADGGGRPLWGGGRGGARRFRGLGKPRFRGRRGSRAGRGGYLRAGQRPRLSRPRGRHPSGLRRLRRHRALGKEAVKARATQAHREKEVSRIRLNRRGSPAGGRGPGRSLKALGTLPGVTNQNDMSVRPFVRGGKAEETQVLWEGIPLLQPYHFGSIYSIFNMESLEDMTLYSGGFPGSSPATPCPGPCSCGRGRPPWTASALSPISPCCGATPTRACPREEQTGSLLSYQAFWYDWVFDRRRLVDRRPIQ